MAVPVPGSLEPFPINLRKYTPLEFYLDEESLCPTRKEQLQTNLDLVRDTIAGILPARQAAKLEPAEAL